jgi:hypothetical protein
MKSGLTNIAKQVSANLEAAETTLTSSIKHTMPDYITQLIWQDENQCHFIILPDETPEIARFKESIAPQALIQDSALDQIKGSGYILVKGHLFYVEKAREKITEINLTAEQQALLKKISPTSTSAEQEAPELLFSNQKIIKEIQKITGHKIERPLVNAIRDTELPAVEFSKHAILALQEAKELAENMAALYTQFQKVPSPSPMENREEKKAEQDQKNTLKEQAKKLGKIFLKVAAADVTQQGLDALRSVEIDEKAPPASLLEETSKLGVVVASKAIKKVPLLQQAINITAPLHQTMLLALVSYFSPAAALYTQYANWRYYADTGLPLGSALVKGAKKLPAVFYNIKENIQKIEDHPAAKLVHSWIKFYWHCQRMYKMAKESHLAPSVLSQIKKIQTQLAELQAEFILNRGEVNELLSRNFSDISQTLATLTETYFVGNQVSSLQEEKTEEKTQESMPILPVKTEIRKTFESSLVETIMTGSQSLYDLFQKFTAQRQGLEAEERDLIAKTLIAIADSKESNGYYKIDLEFERETPLSKNLKAVFNMCRGIELLIKNASTMDYAGLIKALEHQQKAFDSFKEINWEIMHEAAQVHANVLVNALINRAVKNAAKKLEEIAVVSHKIELDHHLRFGSLLKDIRPFFDDLANICHQRGLSYTANPFGYSQKQHDELTSQLQQAQLETTDLAGNSEKLVQLLDRLEWYDQFRKAYAAPGSLFRKIGYEGSQMAENVAEQVIQLLHLLIESHETFLAGSGAEDATMVYELENFLLSELSYPQKKAFLASIQDKMTNPYHAMKTRITTLLDNEQKHKDQQAAENAEKSYPELARDKIRQARIKLQTPKKKPVVPVQEVKGIIKNKLGTLADKLLNVAKYAEAIKAHELIKTDYARTALKKEGLSGLIKAVKEGANDTTKNIAEKRQLAILLADINAGDRAVYLEKAHAITVDFVNDAEKINNLLDKIKKIDTTLSETLALQLALDGHITDLSSSKALLKAIKDQKIDPVVARQQVATILEKFDPYCLVAMFNNKDKTVRERAELFLSLLTEVSVAYYVMTNTGIKGLEREMLLDIMITCYKELEKEPDPAMQHKIGSFLTQLAAADHEIAKNIFSSDKDQAEIEALKNDLISEQDKAKLKYTAEKYQQVHAILKKESLAYPENNFYYCSALIKGFVFDDKPETWEKFVATNKAAILILHKASFKNELGEEKEIIDKYSQDAWSFFQLLKKSSKENTVLNDFYDKFYAKITAYNALLDISPSPARKKVIQSVEDARKKLSDGMLYLFSDCSNKKIIWAESKAEKLKAMPVAETDPEAIQFLKHSLSVLEKAEEINPELDQLLIKLKIGNQKFNAISQHGALVLTHLKDILHHLNKMHELSKKLNIPAEKLEQINTLIQSMRALSGSELLAPENFKNLLSEKLHLLTKTLTEVPALLIDAYKAKPVEQKSTVVLPAISGYQLAAEKPMTLFAELKESSTLAIGSLLSGSKNIHDFFKEYCDKTQKKGVLLPVEEIKLIQGTLAILKHATIDSAGYYPLMENENTITQDIKKLFNLLVKIKALTQAGMDISLYTDIINEIGKIQWTQAAGIFSEFTENLKDSMLLYAKHHYFPFIKDISQESHEIEFKNHFRFGVLLEKIRPFFYKIETIFHQRGLPGLELFGNDPAEKSYLQEKLAQASVAAADNVLETEQYTEALAQYKKMQYEPALCYLQEHGITPLLLAAQHSSEAEEMHYLDKKRQLLAVLYQLKDKSDFLEKVIKKPQEITADFSQDPHQIKNFIKVVYDKNPAVGHIIALEALLGGHVTDYGLQNILQSTNSTSGEKDLMHILQRLPPQQILGLLEKKDTVPTAFFITLLKGEPLTEKNISTTIDNMQKTPLTKKDLFNYCLNYYNKIKDKNSLTPLTHSLGIFIKELAKLDVEIRAEYNAVKAELQTEPVSPRAAGLFSTLPKQKTTVAATLAGTDLKPKGFSPLD